MNDTNILFSMLNQGSQFDYPLNPVLFPYCMIYESDILIHQHDEMEILVAELMEYERRCNSGTIIVGEITEHSDGFNISEVKYLDWESSQIHPLTVIESKLYERLEFSDGSYILESYFEHKNRAVIFSKSQSWIFLVKKEFEWAILGFNPLTTIDLVKVLVQNTHVEAFRYKSMRSAINSNPGMSWIFGRNIPTSVSELQTNYEPHFWKT
ncbi:MAG: hypothetical protein NW241_01705 [Bacteroidia bacterium]|nr:hypothetical protein [Bacteroidia bacterium]